MFYNVYPIPFSFSALAPTSIQYDVKWLLDYAAVPNENGTSITLQPWELGQEPHVLQAIVADTTWYTYQQTGITDYPTRFVRSDPLGLMSDTLTWYLQYKLDGPEAVVSIEGLGVSVTGRYIRIQDHKAWELYSQRRIEIYDIRGRHLQTFRSNGIVSHQWQAPSGGVFFIRINDARSQTKKVVVR